MNCFQARQPLLTDPSRLPADVAEHVTHCPRCKTTANAIRTLDQRVARAMVVEPPAGFESRLKLAARRERPAVRRPRLLIGAALAASVALAAVVIPDVLRTGGDVNWSEAMIAHIAHDPMHAREADGDAEIAFRTVVNDLGGQVSAIPGGLTRARLCILEGQAALHAVIESAGERLVVYLVPGVTTTESEVNLQGWHGRIVSTSSSTMAVLGDSGALREASVRAVMDSLERSVQWRTAQTLADRSSV